MRSFFFIVVMVLMVMAVMTAMLLSAYYMLTEKRPVEKTWDMLGAIGEALSENAGNKKQDKCDCLATLIEKLEESEITKNQ